MAGHTSRPWHLEVEVVNLWIHGPQGEVIATLPNTPQGRTNARLIAAAPDLLAALQKYVKWIQDDRIRSRRNITADHIIEDARTLLTRIEESNA